MVSAVKAHALAHYIEGWDVVVECFGSEDIAQMIQGATSDAEAIAKVGAFVRTHSAISADIRGA